MEQNTNRRPNRHSNPNGYTKQRKNNDKFLFIRQRNRAVREVLKGMA